jgi:hypothetical protein
MINELYTSLIPHIVEHGYKLNDCIATNSAVDRLHAVISRLYNPERYFIYLGNKSFLIRKYDDNHETRENRRSVPFV